MVCLSLLPKPSVSYRPLWYLGSLTAFPSSDSVRRASLEVISHVSISPWIRPCPLSTATYLPCGNKSSLITPASSRLFFWESTASRQVLLRHCHFLSTAHTSSLTDLSWGVRLLLPSRWRSKDTGIFMVTLATVCVWVYFAGLIVRFPIMPRLSNQIGRPLWSVIMTDMDATCAGEMESWAFVSADCGLVWYWGSGHSWKPDLRMMWHGICMERRSVASGNWHSSASVWIACCRLGFCVRIDTPVAL